MLRQAKTKGAAGGEGSRREKSKNRKAIMLLLLGIILCFGICGAGAYFVRRMEKHIEARAAKLSLTVQSFGKEGELDRKISSETVLELSGAVTNNGEVPVYLSEEPLLELNGETAEEDAIRMTLLHAEAEETALQPGESRSYVCRLTFPGADRLPEGSQNLLAELLITACTDRSGEYGFKSGPYALLLGDFSGENALEIPLRQKRICLTAVYEKGTDALEQVCWFRSTAGTRSDNPKGDEITDWCLLTSADGRTEELLLKSGECVLVYYELRTAETTVRSNLYRFSFEGGVLQQQEYDYFSGEEVQGT